MKDILGKGLVFIQGRRKEIPMKDNVYLFKSGELKRKDNTLAYILNDKTNYFPIEQIDAVHCFGEMKLNKRVLEFLSSYKTGIYFYNRYGRCIGKFHGKSYRSGKDVLLQAESFINEDKRNRIIYSMERASIENCINITKYYRKQGYDLDKAILELETAKDKVEKLEIQKDDFYNRILLLEANAKRVYYSIFDEVFKESCLSFGKRECFPPSNEVNALMSFLYALMYNDVLNAIERSMLIPEISFIHGNSKPDRGGLQFDIADYLKPQIADRLFLRLIRSKKIDQSHCYRTISNSCFLNEEGRKLVLKEYDKQLKSSVIDCRNGRKYSYKQFYYREIYELENAMKGNGEYKCAVFGY